MGLGAPGAGPGLPAQRGGGEVDGPAAPPAQGTHFLSSTLNFLGLDQFKV